MKKSILISGLLLSNFLFADFYNGDRPPEASYDLLQGTTYTQQELDSKIQEAILKAKNDQLNACKADPLSCGITPDSNSSGGITQEYMNEQIEFAINTAKTEQLNACKTNPSSCGISADDNSTQFDQSDIDKAVAQAILEANEELIKKVIQNPADYNITASSLINPIDDISLDSGWHLLGTSIDIDPNRFNTSQIVWKFKNGTWEVFSRDENTNEKLKDRDDIPRFEVIEKNSGFWILKP